MNDTQKRIQTDRKSLRKSMDKSMKTIRLKTDYQEIMQNRQKESSASKIVNHNQVSTKHTEEYSNKIIYISKSDLAKIQKQYKKLQEQNCSLKKEMDFYCKSNVKYPNNSVLKALNI